MAIPSGPPPSQPYNPVVPFPTTGYYWATSYYYNFSQNWILTGTGLGVNKLYPNTNKLPKLIYRNSTPYKFKKNRGYQYITQVGNFYTAGLSFSINTAWGTFADFDTTGRGGATVNLLPPSPGNGYLYYYSNPPADTTTSDMIIYQANSKFGHALPSPSQSIYKAQIYEVDFVPQGYAWWRDGNSTSSTSLSLSASTDGKGWTYYDDTKSWIWFDDVSGTIFPAYSYYGTFFGLQESPIQIKGTNSAGNYLLAYIPDANFNLSFTFTKVLGTASDSLDIYLSQEPPTKDIWDFYNTNPSSVIPQNSTLVASYTQSGSTYSAYFGLQGGQYLIIVASQSSLQSSNQTVLAISNIQISAGYWSGNNRRYITTNTNNFYNPTPIIGLGMTGATFSTYTGTGNTYNATQSLDVQQLFSKVGNGRFLAGIWENGVWNSGWRYDELVYEFYSIGLSYNYSKNKVWRFQILGPSLSLEKFSVGDKISVGNIIAIDFNEKRKLLKGYYTILQKDSQSLTVEVINNFPLKRIEVDSPNHRIKITKNVWLSGLFLNGYFTGVWNNGLFKGYPLLTEMYNSHWIDGTLDGGHFYAEYHSVTFSNTYFYRGSKVGLSFSTPHKLNVGDTIFVDKTFKGINARYDGTASVVGVPDEYQILTDIDYNLAPSQSETGTIYTSISSGLIQNFIFKSNNKSRLTSIEYLDSEAVFLYNSWIDVNYFSYSAVNIGRPNTLKNNVSQKEFSANNLYGYPTDDVLSSESTFRNSYNLAENTYKLGTKYTIYNDFIGDSSTFQNYFNPTNTNPDLFLSLGWTYSTAGPNSIIFSRHQETTAKSNYRAGFSYSWVTIREDLLVGSELQVDSIGSGGVLNITEPIIEVDSRVLEKIKRTRYSMIEFNLVRWSGASPWYETNDSKLVNYPPWYYNYKSPNLIQPTIHFDNLNTTIRDVNFISDLALNTSTYSVTVNATYFPVWQNVNHLLTPVSKKVEYFYNKTELSMNFRGSGFFGAGASSSVIIDNLKYYEVDMIPFFQYFTEENINFGVQVPYQGISPFIDYSNANFDFIENVNLGFDSFAVGGSNVAVSGVGVGIGLGNIGGVVVGEATFGAGIGGGFYGEGPGGGGLGGGSFGEGEFEVVNFIP